MMYLPEDQFILLRTPRKDKGGNRCTVFVSVLKKKDTDLTGYSYFKTNKTLGAKDIEEWVPTEELELYKRTIKD